MFWAGAEKQARGRLEVREQSLPGEAVGLDEDDATRWGLREIPTGKPL